MIDQPVRTALPKYLEALLKPLNKLGVTPNQLTVFAFMVSLGSAYAIISGQYFLAILLWWISRLFDALDGIYARKYNKATSFGAYLDVQLDMAAYSIMVVAFYLQFPQHALQWLIIIGLYVLCIAGALSLGGLEKELNIHDSSQRGLRLATGLAEAGETGIMYTVFLLYPSSLFISTWLWIVILVITVLARFVLAKKNLSEFK